MRSNPNPFGEEALAQQLTLLKQVFLGQTTSEQAALAGDSQPPMETQSLPSAIATGLTTGALGVLFDLSFAVLIFSNNLSDYLSAGIGFILFSAAITRIVVGLMSSFPGMVSDLAGIPTAILSWSTGMVIRQMPTDASSVELLITVVVTIAITSLLTGGLLWLIGALKLGNIVRLLPDAVVGGFIASSGWLLVKGAFEVLTGQALAIAPLLSLFNISNPTAHPMQWIPGILLTIYLLIVTRHRNHPMLMTGSLVVATGLFYGVLSLIGISIAQANAQGFTLGVPSFQTTWQILSWSDLSRIGWSAIGAQWMCSGTVSVLTAILLLMNVKCMEVVLAKEIDVNHELKVAGGANILMGLGGGILSFQSFGRSLMAHNMGGRTRLVTLISAATFIVLPLLCSPILTYFPTTLLGGLLLYLGSLALIEWVIRARKKLSTLNYSLVQLIWLVSAIVGFLQGLALGWAIAIGLIIYQSVQQK